MQGREERRQQTIGAHRIKHAGLTIEGDQRRGCQSEDGGDIHQRREPRQFGADRVDGDEDRLRHTEIGVGGQPGHHQAHGDINQ